MRIGLISDTHGLLRPEVLDYLQGSDHILHAGDIGEREVIDALEALAPVTAVLGNNDRGLWDGELHAHALAQFDAIRIYVLHDLKQLDFDPVEVGLHVVVSGHTHKPLLENRNGVLFVNPGSAGRRRFQLPIAAGELIIEGDKVTAHIREFNA